MRRKGKVIVQIKLIENLTEETALEVERALIQLIGRYPFGPLTNLTPGGEGVSGLEPGNEG